ncbi:MAG: hypothetical protein JWO56_1104 [Acidobacteria bacterium]|nr:hypothetical protein [Acidobacteriota bacterium]
MKRGMLVAMAVLSLAAAAAYLAFDPAPSDVSPRRIRDIGPWLERYPGDWIASSIVVDKVLDSPLPQRDPLWRAAYAHALLLAPYRDVPRLVFLRSGLSHWYELGPDDRRLVVDNAARMLPNHQHFFDLYRSVWEVTGDFALLRRANPGTADAFRTLMGIAGTNGLFAEYREARDAFLRQRLAEFRAERAMMPSAAISNVLPEQLVGEDQPLLQAALDEWHRRPLDTAPEHTVAGAIEYALRHDLQPLDGLDYLVTHPFQSDPLRARLAIRNGLFDRATDLEISSSVVSPAEWRRYHVERAYAEAKRGDTAAVRIELFKAAQGGLDAEVLAAAAALQRGEAARAELLLKFSTPTGWAGLCEADICRSATAQWYTAGPAGQTLTLSTVQTDEYPPYVEIYADDVRVAEGPAGERTPFTIASAGAGVHRIEIRIANPLTRNLLQRRVRIVSSSRPPD